ncbi:MAG: protein kinase, partial [Cyanobacteria bacterium J06649_4]
EVETRLGKGYALVQTYIQAPSLKEIVDAGHRFRESQLQPMAQALLFILYYLHSCYPMVIHRDIKPSNILLKAKTAQTPAKLYLIDFGSVQTAQTDGTMTVVGTYGYMPPEQFGGRAKPASDLYSLGATLIYLATGKHPTELMQESLQIQFSEHVGFSESFTQWLATLTHTSLSARTATAKQALQQLKAPQLKSAGSESLLASGSTVAGNKALSRTLSRGDISIVVRPNEMEIQCLRSRIREPLRQRKSINELNKSDNLDSVGIVSALLTGSVSSCFCAAVILFINMWKTGINAAGFFAVLSLVQFIIVIAVISGVDLSWYPHHQHDASRKVSIKLARRHDQTILLSLITLPWESTQQGSNNMTEAAVVHFSKVPLKRLKAMERSGSLSSYVRFTTTPEFIRFRE